MGLCSSSSRGPRRFSRRPRRVRIDSSPGDILHEEMNARNDDSVAELHTYIRNNQDVIPNGTRFWQGERISTAVVESMVTKLVSKRFVKKQQMQLTSRGAHCCRSTRKCQTTIWSRRFGNGTFVPACCSITPDFLADSRLPVHFAPAESP